MRHRPLFAPLAGLVLLLTALALPLSRPQSLQAADPVAVTLQPLVTGLTKPVGLATANDGSGALYVIEQPGRIRVIRGGTLDPQAFLDIRSIVGSGGSEQGLLGLAFHPDFANNGLFYVNYTDVNGDTVIARYTANAGHRTADPASAKRLMFIDQPFANHNGGQLAFGPDGYLWIATGDGGSGGDPQGNGQNPSALLGKLLRIDVNAGDPYTIPADNPYASGGGAAEVWALGLRNPWRFSFDRATGDLYIADVGQNNWEEIDVAPAGSQPLLNFGWNIMEATHCYPPGRTTCDGTGLIPPVLEYPTGQEGCSVTGGYVYRGSQYPALTGRYLYSDYCKGFIRSLQWQDGQWLRAELRAAGTVMISSFGQDEAGELYVTGHNTGTVYRVAGPAPSTLPAPQLTAPASGTRFDTMGPYQLTWQNPAGATQYHLQVRPANDDGPGVNLIVSDAATVAAAAFTLQPPVFGAGPYVLLPDMTYTWRVRVSNATTAIDENDASWGPWASSTFRTPARPWECTGCGPLPPITPRDGEVLASTAPVRVQWQNVHPAVFYYEVQVSTDPEFRTGADARATVWWNLIHGGISTPPDSWVTPPLEPGKGYHWRIRPRIQGDGTPAAWLPQGSFRTP